jgi:hypothetical protein
VASFGRRILTLTEPVIHGEASGLGSGGRQ